MKVLVRRFVLVFLRNIASHAQSLEGNRFVVWQFYRLAASRLPGITQRKFLRSGSVQAD
jgi:hypothetical protein